MIASRSSLNIDILQSDLLKESVHATIPVPGREEGTQSSRSQGHATSRQLETNRPTERLHGPNNANPILSFLPSTVPESVEHIVGKAGAVTEGALMEEEEDAQSQGSDNVTQEISQSALEVVRCRSEQRSLHDDGQIADRDDREDQQEDSLQEGDSNFLDIISSFAVPLVDQEPVSVDFSPSQPQPPLTQFPESQRFKTPATAGKKRDYNGNTIDTPAVSRNPFARDGQQTPGNVVGLSQAFAQTQAASSPFVNVPTSALRSDRPSPGLDVERHVAHPPTSSPLRPLSDVKRATTEPAERYVPAGHSQLFRSGSVDEADLGVNTATHSTDYDGFDSSASALDRQRRARIREARAREQLKTASSPMSPKMHNPMLPRRAESERPELSRRTSTNSLPSSPPPIDTAVEAGVSSEEAASEPNILKDGIAAELETSVQQDSPLVPTAHEQAPATVIPDTTKRVGRVLAQSLPPPQPSPSARQMRSGRAVANRRCTSSGPVRVANSQRSAPSTQDPARNFLATSSGDSVDVVPASPERELVATQPSYSPRPQRSESQRTSHEEEDDDRADHQCQSSSYEEHNRDRPPTSTISETNSGRDASDIQRHSTYATAPIEFSSQPVLPPQGRKRKRIEDISQENAVPPATQSSSFDAGEALALDEDPDAAQALASTQDEDPVLPRKRARFSHSAAVPRLEVEETRCLSNGTNANIGRRANSRNAELSSGDDDIENDFLQYHDDDDDHELPAVNAVAKTPTKMVVRKSAWDMDDSPKPQHVPKVLRSRNQHISKTLQHKATQRLRRGASRKPITAPSTLASIEEASPDPLATSAVSTEISTSEESIDEVVAPNMVFAYYMDRTRAWYPATCLGASIGAQQYKIKWAGYEPEDVSTHGICSLDLRIGDEVKVALEKYPKGSFTVRGFRSVAEVAASKDGITDIYGHTHVLIEPKNTKTSLRKGVLQDRVIAIADLYIDLNIWNRVSKRPFRYRVAEPKTDTSGISTPLNRATTPTTPSSRARHAEEDRVLFPFHKDGMFANMVFALSFEDKKMKGSVSDMVTENGGLILQESFRDLVEDSMELKDKFGNLSFAALLADRHSRKEKYMQALAFGFPCLSGKWVEASIKHARLADWPDYLLPAGKSTELGGAIRSRFMPYLDPRANKLSETIAQRTQFFDYTTTIFINGRGKAEDRVPHLTLVQIMGAEKIEKVVKVADLTAAKAKLQRADKSYPMWLFVDDKDYVGACKIVEEVKKEHVSKSRKNSAPAWSCEVADKEFVMQSLIMGRLCTRV